MEFRKMLLGVGDGQGGLACCDSWGHEESDRTERLNCLTEQWPYMQDSKRDTEIKNRLLDSVGEGEGGMI